MLSQTKVHPLNPDKRHDQTTAFPVMREVIDQGFFRYQPAGHHDFDFDVPALLDLALYLLPLSRVNDHDEVTGHLLRLEPHNPPPR